MNFENCVNFLEAQTSRCSMPFEKFNAVFKDEKRPSLVWPAKAWPGSGQSLAGERPKFGRGAAKAWPASGQSLAAERPKLGRRTALSGGDFVQERDFVTIKSYLLEFQHPNYTVRDTEKSPSPWTNPSPRTKSPLDKALATRRPSFGYSPAKRGTVVFVGWCNNF